MADICGSSLNALRSRSRLPLLAYARADDLVSAKFDDDRRQDVGFRHVDYLLEAGRLAVIDARAIAFQDQFGIFTDAGQTHLIVTVRQKRVMAMAVRAGGKRRWTKLREWLGSD